MNKRHSLIIGLMLVMSLLIVVLFLVVPHRGLNAPSQVQSVRWCECVHYVLHRYGLDMSTGPYFIGAADMGPYLESRGFTRVETPMAGAVAVFARSFGMGIDTTYGHVGVVTAANGSSADGASWSLVVRGARQGGAEQAEYGCTNVSDMAIPVSNGNSLIAFYTSPGGVTESVEPVEAVILSPTPSETPVVTLPVPRPVPPTPTPANIVVVEETPVVYPTEQPPIAATPTTSALLNPTVAPVAQAIPGEQTWDESIEPSDDVDEFFFEGEAGWVATIGITSTVAEGASALDSYLTLYAPDGSQVNDPYADDDRGGDGNALIDGVILPQPGRYRIVVQSWQGATSGAYRLSLLLQPGSAVQAGMDDPHAMLSEPRSRSRSEHHLDAGRYRFGVQAGSGVRVYLDGEQVFDGLQAAPPATSEMVVVYAEDGMHTIELEIYTSGDVTPPRFWWERLPQ